MHKNVLVTYSVHLNINNLFTQQLTFHQTLVNPSIFLRQEIISLE